MTTHTDTVHAARFRDMDLRVGQRVQLIVPDTLTLKFYTTIIGWVEGEFLILRVPDEQGRTLHLKQGEALEIRLFSGVSVFAFATRLETLLLHPRNYMLMAFPKAITETRMRSHPRVRASLPVEVLGVDDQVGQWTDFRLDDLSGSGAAIVGPSTLGAAGARISLALKFQLHATGREERVLMDASLQSVYPLETPSARFRHGLKFESIDPRIVLLVQELLQGTPSA